MALRVGSAVRRRLETMQKQLAPARLAAGLEQEMLAESLKVSPRTLRDWERCYEIPSMPNLIGWAHVLGFRLAVVGPGISRELVSVSLRPGESFAEHEVRRLAVVLKARRQDREISQTDLALIVGVSRASLQRWEDGMQDPIVLSLAVWADRLGCRVDLVPDGSLA